MAGSESQRAQVPERRGIPGGQRRGENAEQHKKAENKGQKRQSNVGNAEVIQQGVDAGACLLVFHIGVPPVFF